LAHLPRQEADGIIAATNELVSLYRGADLPIIWVRQEFSPDLSDAFIEMRRRDFRTAIAGTSGAWLVRRLDIHSDDPVIVKKRYSAFFGTDLSDRLARLEVDELALTGVNTHACIRTTAIDAYQRDLTVILASDCMGSYDKEHATVSMRCMDGKIGRAITNAALRTQLQY